MEDTTHSSQAAYTPLPADPPASDTEAPGQAATGGGSLQVSLWQRITSKPGIITILPTFLLAVAYLAWCIWLSVWMGKNFFYDSIVTAWTQGPFLLLGVPTVFLVLLIWVGGPAVALYCCVYAVRAGPHRPWYMKFTLNAGPMLLHFVITAVSGLALTWFDLSHAFPGR